MKLDAVQNYKMDWRVQGQSEMSEQTFVRKLFCVVLCHCIQSVKGGWQHLEETANVLLMHCEQVCLTLLYFRHMLAVGQFIYIYYSCFFFEQDSISYRCLLRDIYEDLVQRLTELSSEDNIFLSQPCRDNTLYLLKLVDDLLIFEIDAKLQVNYMFSYLE